MAAKGLSGADAEIARLSERAAVAERRAQAAIEAGKEGTLTALAQAEERLRHRQNGKRRWSNASSLKSKQKKAWKRQRRESVSQPHGLRRMRIKSLGRPLSVES